MVIVIDNLQSIIISDNNSNNNLCFAHKNDIVVDEKKKKNKINFWPEYLRWEWDGEDSESSEVDQIKFSNRFELKLLK